MLDPLLHNYVITDPAKDDNPIVYASDHFCSFTKYGYDEIVEELSILQGVGRTRRTLVLFAKP